MWFSDAWCGVRWAYWGLAWIDIFSNCRIWVDLGKNSSVEGRKMLRKCFCTENSSAWFVGSITFLQDAAIHLNFRTSKPELLHIQKISYAAGQHQNIDKWSARVNHCNSLIQLWDVMGSKQKFKTSYIPKKNVYLKKKNVYRNFPSHCWFSEKKKKKRPSATKNLRRCTDGISLRRLEDHLGPEKNMRKKPWRCPKKAGTPTGKFRNAGWNGVKRAWKWWKKKPLK